MTNMDDEMTSGPGITGVAEIVLSVGDLPRMRRFYERVLGFALLSQACYEHGIEAEPEGDPTIAFLTITELDTPLGRHGHPQLLALIDYRRHVFAKDRFDGLDPRHSTLNHLAFEIPPSRYEPEHDRLQALGLKPRRVEFAGMHAQALFFHDPEGNLLELICHGSEA